MERSEIELNGSFVLDSSVIIKWFCQEEDTELALKFREEYISGNLNIASPDLIIYEIGNALRYNKNITQQDVKDSIISLIDLGIDIIVPSQRLIESAVSIAFEYNITLYDAYFIALSQEFDFEFVTADESLYEKIKKLKFVRLLKNIKI